MSIGISGHSQRYAKLWFSTPLTLMLLAKRCFEAEGCGLMLLLPFNGDLKERYDDGYFCNDFQ